MEYKIKIEGITPYMQHRMDDIKLAEWEKKRGNIIERADANVEDAHKAEYHCYRDEATGQCYIPAEHIYGSLIGAGGYIKSKVGAKTKSMKSIVAAMFMISPTMIFMPDFDAIDKRSAVNHNIKGRIITVRPKWTNWEAEFLLNTGRDSTITTETVSEIVRYAGDYVGIGSFRPTANGPFGRFKMVSINQA